MTYQILQGDCLETLKTLPECSVQTCVTSPPYYGLRDYGNDAQIGLEQSPEEYIAKLVEVFREVRRVLKDDGTLWLNLGDSYNSGSGGYDDKYEGGFVGREDIKDKVMKRKGRADNSLAPKQLMMIPARVALALQADGWWLRSEIIWHKPNPMPESVTDRPTKSHEMIYLLAKSARYFYDAEAIKEPANYDGRKDEIMHGSAKYDSAIVPGDQVQSMARDGHVRWNKNADGLRVRNKRDVWVVTTKPYKEAHFATFPPDLIEPCILAGSAEGDTVLDPFNGSGTTGEVSIKHKREYVGCELNPEYIELTHKRLANVDVLLF